MPRKSTTGRGANGNGSIRKITTTRNGKSYTYWQARYTEGFDAVTGKQIQRSITGKTQKEVAQKLKECTYEIDQGTYQAPSKMTVGEWFTIWLREYLGAVKPSTSYLYERVVELYIRPRLGQQRLDSLKPHMIQAFYNRLHHPEQPNTDPLSAKTIKNIHGVFHKGLQQAVLNGCLRTNPADACVLPKINKKELHPMDEVQAAAFLKEISGHQYEQLYKIALFTGLREGEVLGLTWDCVDLDKGTLLVKQQLRREQKKGGKFYFSSPKNGKSRCLTLAPTVVKQFRLQRLRQNAMRMEAGSLWEEHNLIFTNAVGYYLSYRTIYDCFKRIVKRIGTPETRFHDLRHTYAIVAIKSGDDIKTVQENLGHATAAFTLDIYCHVTEQMKQSSADRMEQFIQSVSNG